MLFQLGSRASKLHNKSVYEIQISELRIMKAVFLCIKLKQSKLLVWGSLCFNSKRPC